MRRNKWVSPLCALLVHWGLKINVSREGQPLQPPRNMRKYLMRQHGGQAPEGAQMGRGQQVASIYLDYSEAEIRSHPRTMDVSCHQKNLERGDIFFIASNTSSHLSSWMPERKWHTCWKKRRIQKLKTKIWGLSTVSHSIIMIHFPTLTLMFHSCKWELEIQGHWILAFICPWYF